LIRTMYNIRKVQETLDKKNKKIMLRMNKNAPHV